MQIGQYTIRKNGDVYSEYSNKVIKPYKIRGYLGYSLIIDGKRKVWYAHRLIATAFIPNPENKELVNHKDGNKHNNSVENLEWVTKKENAIHACSVLGVNRGEKNGMTKLTNDDHKFIMSSNLTNSEIGGILNVSYKTIWAIRKGKRWKTI